MSVERPRACKKGSGNQLPLCCQPAGMSWLCSSCRSKGSLVSHACRLSHSRASTERVCPLFAIMQSWPQSSATSLRQLMFWKENITEIRKSPASLGACYAATVMCSAAPHARTP